MAEEGQGFRVEAECFITEQWETGMWRKTETAELARLLCGL